MLNRIKNKYIKVLGNLKTDLIISQHFPINYFCSYIKRKKKVKHIYYCHEPYRLFHDKNYYSNAPIKLRIISFFLRLFFKKYDYMSLKNVDNIVCNSKFTKNNIKKIYGMDSYIVYPVLDMDNSDTLIDFDLKQRLKLNQNNLIVFTLGLTHHMKGVKELIFIFNKILKEMPEVILLIGGNIIKGNEKIIYKMRKKLKIPSENIILYGLIQNELLNYFYAQSTITLYTAIDEPFGLIPLESLKNGTPIIAFEGGPSETVLDGQTGYIIKNNDLDDFVQKTLKLMNDRNLYEKFSQNAKTHIRKNFTFINSFKKLESIFQEVISKN